MVDMRTIKVAREVGYDALKEMNALKRSVKSSQTGVSTAHFELGNPTGLTTKMAERNPIISPVLDLAKRLFPRTFSPEVKTAIDIEVQKQGAHAGVVKISSISRDAEGIVSQAKADLAASESMMGFHVNGTAEKGTKVNYRGTIVKDAELDNIAEESKNLVNGIKYQEADGMSELALSSESIGPVRDLSVELTAPTEYMDGISQIYSGKKFGELLAEYKAMV